MVVKMLLLEKMSGENVGQNLFFRFRMLESSSPSTQLDEESRFVVQVSYTTTG